MKNFYITTTLPYVNAEPHIGHAMEFIRADIIARAKKLQGYKVFFNTGTDEHGLKIYQKAKSLNQDVQLYVDQSVENFKKLLPLLGISEDVHFIRTTDKNHIETAQYFWKLVDKNGYIYKKNYSTKYCIGCELEKTDSELTDGKCPIHPLQNIELIQEENYFFKFSAFADKLLQLYKNNPKIVIPDFRLNEIRSFVEMGLEDFSVSRLATKMPWGVPVPTDPAHVMYVWFDALVNYISTLGWPGAQENFNNFWVNGTPVQYCGKDNLRQQSAMWQAMLMAADLSPTHNIIINGFITGEGGVKMSKSLGNVINPLDVVNEYGTDALRLYVVKDLSPFEDSPFTMAKFKESYNANLANGIGNLVSRIMKMATTNGIIFDKQHLLNIARSSFVTEIKTDYDKGLEIFDIQKSANAIWKLIANTDSIIQQREPFKKIKVHKDEAVSDIKELLSYLHIIGELLIPIIPNTAKLILDLVEGGKMPDKPLFMRKI
jgi:methionyl-tRNA synthetase